MWHPWSKWHPWPQWPRVFGIDYGHAEVRAATGKDPRVYSVMTKELIGDDEGNVKALVTQDVEMTSSGPKAIEGSEREWPADLVVLSMGFLSPEAYVTEELGLDVDQRNNIQAVYVNFINNIGEVSRSTNEDQYSKIIFLYDRISMLY